MKRCLLIVASGKSSRFGGFPKAFCSIGDKTNVQNTIDIGRRHFDVIYVAVNTDIYKKYHTIVKNAEIFPIVTGQGDAHSVLKAIKYVKEKQNDLSQIYVCWGDAVFISDNPFAQFQAKCNINGDLYKACVACSLDSYPYAWFDVDADMNIITSHFSKFESAPLEGIHDQSLFLLDVDFAINTLDQYRETLGIPYENNPDLSDKNEMKLLYYFNYLREKYNENTKCIIIDKLQVLSFNTKDELQAILNGHHDLKG